MPDPTAPTAQNTQPVATAPAADPTSQPRANPVAAPVAPIPDPAVAERAATAERSRIAELMSLCELHRVPVADQQRMVRDGVTVEAARAEILARYAAPAPASNNIVVGKGTHEHAREAMEGYILGRYESKHVKATAEVADKGSRLRGMTFSRAIEWYFDQTGVKLTDRSPSHIAARALGGMGTSDFPNLAANIMTKFLSAEYKGVEPKYRLLGRKESASDFKPMKIVNLGLGSSLADIPENGEVPGARLTDYGEPLALKTLGRFLSITRQMIINDDLGGLTRIPSVWGWQAANTENIKAWSLITANANLSDGVPLFHANHANLGGSTALGQTGISEGRTKLQLQTDPDGNTLDLNSDFLVVPAALRTAAERETTQVIPNQTSGVNPFAGMKVISEPQLDKVSTTAYFLASDNPAVDTFVWTTLNGSDTPTIEEFYQVGRDGVELRILWDWACGIGDFRGIVKMPGV